MARIRPYARQVDPSAEIPTRMASAADFEGAGLAQMGQGMQALGSSLARGVAIERYDEQHLAHAAQVKAEHLAAQESSIKLHELGVAAQIALRQAGQEVIDKGDPHDPIGLAETAKTRAENIVQDFVNAAHEPGSKILPLDVQRLRATLNGAALLEQETVGNHAAKQYGAAIEHDTKAYFGQIANVVGLDPSKLQWGRDAVESYVRGLPMLPRAAQDRLIEDKQSGLAGESLQGEVNRALSPNATSDQIRGFLSRLTDGESGDRYRATVPHEVYQHAIELSNQHLAVVAKREGMLLVDGVNAALHAYGQTGNGRPPTVQELTGVASHIDDERDRRKFLLNAQEELSAGDARRQLRGLNHDGQVQYVEEARKRAEAGGANFSVHEAEYKAVKGAFEQRQAEIAKDMASVALRESPALQKVYERMQKNEPGAFTQFASFMDAWGKVHAPNVPPTYLTPDQVGQVKSNIATMTETAGGAEQAMGVITGMQKQWGARWPTVLRQLEDAKALTPEQSMAARMAADPAKVTDAIRLLSLTANDAKPPTLTSVQTKDLREALGKGLAAFSRWNVGQVRGPQVIEATYAAVEKLAQALVVAGKDPKVAVKDALAKVGVNDYHYKATDLMNAAIPTTGYNPDRIEAGAAIERGKMALHGTYGDIVMPRGYGDGTYYRPADVLDALQNKTTWVTAADGKSVQLLWPGGEPVMATIGGKLSPVVRSLKELERAGESKPSSKQIDLLMGQ